MLESSKKLVILANFLATEKNSLRMALLRYREAQADVSKYLRLLYGTVSAVKVYSVE
jgi:hypothetical protein